MKLTIFIIQILASIILMAVILIQSKGTGLSSGFGSFGEFYRSKRGMEKTIFIVTIILATLFLLTSIANILLD